MLNILLLFLFSLSEILWVVPDNPPFQILNDQYKDKGIGDNVQKLLISELKDYKHDMIQAHLKRAIGLSKYKLVCVALASINEERSKYFIQSTPFGETGQLQLAIHKEKEKELLPFVLKTGEVDFEQASKKIKLTIGNSGGKSYGKFVDQAILNFENRGYSFKRMAQYKMVDNMYKMFLSNRTDIFVDYQESLYYLIDLLSATQSNIKYYPIQSAHKVKFGVICSKTKVGQKLIEEINKNIFEKIRKVVYESYLDLFSKNASFIKNIKKRYENKEMMSIGPPNPRVIALYKMRYK